LSATDQPSARAKLDQREPHGDPAAAKRYLRMEDEPRSGLDPAEGPRPLEFDANGFPVPQRSSSFVKRVERLVNPL
jgi:hypothetical protein